RSQRAGAAATARARSTRAAPSSSPAAPFRQPARSPAAARRWPPAHTAKWRGRGSASTRPPQYGKGRAFSRSCENSAFPARVQAIYDRNPRKSTSRMDTSTSTESGITLVLTTLGADADAQALARSLVEERLAACVNILPAMVSVYDWKGSIVADREQQLVIKTSHERAGELREWLD